MEEGDFKEVESRIKDKMELLKEVSRINRCIARAVIMFVEGEDKEDIEAELEKIKQYERTVKQLREEMSNLKGTLIENAIRTMDSTDALWDYDNDVEMLKDRLQSSMFEQFERGIRNTSN